MSYLQQDTNVTLLTWPITQRGSLIAQRFAADHSHPHIVERVRQNTLAVWVIHEFFDALGISTDLSASDSWNPAIQALEDVADLVVPGVGRLECRPVSAETNRCQVPQETLTERIGYIAVALDEKAGEASLLGFMPELLPTQTQLPLEQLQPMENFPNYLQKIRQQWALTPEHLTQLSQWLEGHFESSWQIAEDFLARHVWTPAFRKSEQALLEPQPQPQTQIKRAKQLDLDLGLGKERVGLVVELAPEDSLFNVYVRLYPLSKQLYLLEDVTMKVLDEKGKVYLIAKARERDNCLQLCFRGRIDERFSVQVIFEDVCLVEDFMI